MISDVEAMIYEWMGLPREHWDDETWTAFTAIRHKLLDKAGEITRLPENLISPERSPAPFEQA